MAFSPGSRDDSQIAEINVTPFVDVVLVLLIIFMITAGVTEFGLEIDVPRTKEVAGSAQDFSFVNITSTGELFYNTEPVMLEDIAVRVEEDADSPDEMGIYVRAHKTTPWEVIAQVVAQCGAAGVEVAMVTKPLERNPGP